VARIFSLNKRLRGTQTRRTVGCVNLRERKKEATRRALSRAALELALEHGPENVRVEDIASAAGVSPRTYNNYFSSREAAICAARIDANRRLGDRLRERPADEPLAEACVQAVLEHWGQDTPDRRFMGMVFHNPALQGEIHKNFGATAQPLIAAVAERCGLDPERDMFPTLLAAALASAIRVATLHWLGLPCRAEQPGRPGPPDHGTERPFRDVLEEALRHVVPMASGFTRP
jgi:AcrR family transcriptional regulator